MVSLGDRNSILFIAKFEAERRRQRAEGRRQKLTDESMLREIGSNGFAD
jgi:hypothetical protein